MSIREFMELQAVKISAKRLIQASIRDKVVKLHSAIGEISNSEILYQNVFLTSAERMELSTPPLYPLRGAANYSLLYVLLRALSEVPITRVLELGAGQSTILLDALAAKLPKPPEILTVETDEAWADRMQKSVRHEVRHNPLLDSGEYSTAIDGKFDLVIVDGPRGKRRNSRASCLPLLRSNLADDFLVVFDDAQRRGERDTYIKFADECEKLDGVSFVHGSSSQALLFSKKFSYVQFF